MEETKDIISKLYLDKEKDIVVSIINEKGELFYEIETPRHNTSNILQNLLNYTSKKSDSVLRNEMFSDEVLDNPNTSLSNDFFPQVINTNEKFVLKGKMRELDEMQYTLELGSINFVDLDLTNGNIQQNIEIPTAIKVMMAESSNFENAKLLQTQLELNQNLKTNLHTHATAELEPEKLLALGLKHNIKYSNYYIFALDLDIDDKQKEDIKNSIRGALEKREPQLTDVEIKEETEKTFNRLEKNRGNKDELRKESLDIRASYGTDLRGLVDGRQENLEEIFKSLSIDRERASKFFKNDRNI